MPYFSEYESNEITQAIVERISTNYFLINKKLKRTPPPEKEGWYYFKIVASDRLRVLEVYKHSNGYFMFWWHNRYLLVLNGLWYGEVPMPEVED